MRTFQFDLKKYKGVNGKLVLTIPTYRQRLQMVKECDFKTDDEGNISVGLDSIDSIVKLLDVAKPFFQEVDLKIKTAPIKTFEEMEEYPECDALLTDAASAVLNAGRLGK